MDTFVGEGGAVMAHEGAINIASAREIRECDRLPFGSPVISVETFRVLVGFANGSAMIPAAFESLVADDFRLFAKRNNAACFGKRTGASEHACRELHDLGRPVMRMYCHIMASGVSSAVCAWRKYSNSACFLHYMLQNISANVSFVSSLRRI
ncbi:hypothetical protein [Pararhizobium arenae]|uniref:hypothetical protein n=1 Tax=Pararhizobium arenae TaxID=1856850 RepID=UPI001FDA85FF|nr:hypothetical protein [Pararhizobium arenae]